MEQKKTEYKDLESAMKRLDEVVSLLSAENISLERSLELYEEGVSLVKIANARLEDAQRKINMLKMSADGEVGEVPFDTSCVL
ncbi:MAG: exodeoxyribonuclease VII small subunit [Ruminococcaceae bacterium]|nr:exodeoxyribonuclease VII small subunit [Oscillospiraceae bacterium]